MPKLGSQTLNTASGFNFSAEQMENLDGSDAYTLACIAVDCSSSTYGFTDQIRESVKTVIDACKKHPKQDSILVRVTKFYGGSVNEIIGYTLPRNIDTSIFDNEFGPTGSTPLYDASVESVESATALAVKLAESYYTANAVAFVITDGEENTSRVVKTPKDVLAKFNKVKSEESLDSIKSILIGLCSGSDINSYLSDFKDKAGFDEYVNASLGDAKTFAKLANFVSQSISSTSQAMGTGSPSQPFSF